MNTPLLGIVADDLTGAMDATGTLASCGLKSAVALSPEYAMSESQWEIVCYNTQSRLGAEADAAHAVEDATRRLLELGCRRMYKKIDSTMRGHIGVELTAMMRLSGAGQAFVCPAFPDMSRTVMDGVLYVGGRPLTQAEEGNDPFSGVDDTSTVGLLIRPTGQKVGLVELSEIQGGTANIQRRISILSREGCRFIVFDATLPAHLDCIAEALENNHSREIMVGSAGLTAALARRLAAYSQGKPNDFHENRLTSGPSLTVSGSLNQATMRQLERMRAFRGCKLVPVNVNDVLDGGRGPNSEMIRVASEIRSALKEGLDVGLCWDSPEAVGTALRAYEDRSSNIKQMVLFIQELVRDLVERASVSCLVLVGGETAYTVLGGLKARSINLIGEVERGIPVGKVTGGLAQGTLVVTKAGGFGDEAALVNVISYVRNRLGA